MPFSLGEHGVRTRSSVYIFTETALVVPTIYRTLGFLIRIENSGAAASWCDMKNSWPGDIA